MKTFKLYIDSIDDHIRNLIVDDFLSKVYSETDSTRLLYQIASEISCPVNSIDEIILLATGSRVYLRLIDTDVSLDRYDVYDYDGFLLVSCRDINWARIMFKYGDRKQLIGKQFDILGIIIDNEMVDNILNGKHEFKGHDCFSFYLNYIEVFLPILLKDTNRNLGLIKTHDRILYDTYDVLISKGPSNFLIAVKYYKLYKNTGDKRFLQLAKENAFESLNSVEFERFRDEKYREFFEEFLTYLGIKI